FAASSATVTQVVQTAPSAPIRNGDPESNVSFNGVGMILPTATHGVCSAVLVRHNIVLTAAQCVFDLTPDPVFEFSLGAGRTARVTDIRMHPQAFGFEGFNPAFDVAVGRLDESVASGWTDVVLPAFIDNEPAAGSVGTAVGF